MSLLAWNCQGLGSPWIVQNLGAIILDHHHTLVFLAETKCSSRQIDTLKCRFDMHGVNVDSIRKTSGIALFWDKNIEIGRGQRLVAIYGILWRTKYKQSRPVLEAIKIAPLSISTAVALCGRLQRDLEPIEETRRSPDRCGKSEISVELLKIMVSQILDSQGHCLLGVTGNNIPTRLGSDSIELVLVLPRLICFQPHRCLTYQ
ncbi:UNVERIFIED_CONTAM: hypothetical protein Slati_2647700 [Sesamum latifolium]|uniref:Uncharacterized protein n=1 Tax=Sesamum latifolium TaxID=2727402 RepID=A0AAW2VTS7_9LAMI